MEIPYKSVKGKIIIEVKMGNELRKFIFDTGAEELYSMSNTNMNKFKKTKTFSIISEGFGSNSFGLYGMKQE